MPTLTNAELREILRSHFPILREKTYVNSCSQGALSLQVESALREFIASWHEHGSPWDRWVQRYEEARVVFASFIGAKPDEVAITFCASTAFNAIASSLDFGSRPKVVMGEFEFPTMGHVWLAQQSRGADVRFIEAEGERVPVEAYEREVDNETAIVPVTRVCFTNGFRSDVTRIAEIAHRQGAYVLVDDYQDAGTRLIDVKALGVDFYVTGTLKYLLGSSGVAFLYVREEIISQLTPAVGGWFAQDNPFTFNPLVNELSPTARRFQSGTPPIPNVYATMAGVGLLADIGPENTASHIAELTGACISRARDMRVMIKTPLDSIGPLVVVKCKDAEAMVNRLADQNIIASSRRDGLRLAWHCYNTQDDVDRVIQVIASNIDLMVRE